MLCWDDATRVDFVSRTLPPSLPTCASVASAELFVLAASWQGSLETRPQREMDTAEEELRRQDTVRPCCPLPSSGRRHHGHMAQHPADFRGTETPKR